MAERVRVANVSDVPEGEGRVVHAGGKELALFRVEGAFYALDNTCKHRGGPLGEGEIAGCTVTCPWHGWEYDVRTGQCESAPTSVASYPTKVEGEDVFVEI